MKINWEIILLPGIYIFSCSKLKVKNLPSALTSGVTLTGVSEVEVILNVAGYVVSPFVFDPVCVWLFIIPDENSKQDDHRNLPDEADRREADPNVGVPLPTEKIPHDAASVLSPPSGPRSGPAPWRTSANIGVQVLLGGVFSLSTHTLGVDAHMLAE